MKAVVGLGNPGPKYRKTRHNIGFDVLAELAQRFVSSPSPKIKFEAEVVEIAIGGEKVLLVAPQTFMNRSGRSVRALVDFFQLPLENLLVICDDMNLETGRLRWRRSGSAGGQKGMNDIISHLGTNDFPRLRIGIGRPPGRMAAADYVLGRFHGNDVEQIRHAVVEAADSVELWVREGLDATMNRYNVSSSGP